MGKKDTDGQSEELKTTAQATETPKAAKAVAAEPTYTVRELSGACAQLGKGVTPDLVAAAMVSAGKETATVDEAKAMVEKFMKREVK